MMRTFRELVAIYGPSRKEAAVASYIKRRLAKRFTVVGDDAGRRVGGEIGNLLVRIPGEGEPILLCAHMDTVEPCRGVRVVFKNGYFQSGGDTILGADDRAAVAVLVETALYLSHQKKHRAVEILFTVAEEVGLLGAKNADYRRLKSKTAFVLDASEPPGNLVVAAPSSDIFTATFSGRAAHAGIEPEKGKSTIQMVAAAVAAMRLGRIDHETTANVGVVEGGRAVNIVPDAARLEGEARSHDEEKLRAQVTHMTNAMKEAARRYGGRVNVIWTRAYDRYAIAADAPPVMMFRRAAREVGLRVKLIAGGGGSDANVLNARGITAVVAGCGMEKPHSTGERISAAALRQLGALVTALLKQ